MGWVEPPIWLNFGITFCSVLVLELETSMYENLVKSEFFLGEEKIQAY